MELLQKLADQGVVALLLAISLLINYKLGSMLLDEKDKRIEGAEKLRDDIALRDKYIQEAMQLTTSKIRVSKEAQNADKNA